MYSDTVSHRKLQVASVFSVVTLLLAFMLFPITVLAADCGQVTNAIQQQQAHFNSMYIRYNTAYSNLITRIGVFVGELRESEYNTTRLERTLRSLVDSREDFANSYTRARELMTATTTAACKGEQTVAFNLIRQAYGYIRSMHDTAELVDTQWRSEISESLADINVYLNQRAATESDQP